MALIKCPECGKEISDKAACCPNCGFPVERVKYKAIKCLKCKYSIPADSKYCPNCHRLITIDDFKYSGVEYAESNINSILLKSKKHYSQPDGIPRCPKCNSRSVSYAGNDFSMSGAFWGGLFGGEYGTILGGLSAEKGCIVCLNCGNRWKV